MTGAAATGAVRQFIQACAKAFAQRAADDRSKRMLAAVFGELSLDGFEVVDKAGSRLPVCSHLDEALHAGSGSAALERLTDGFRAVEPFVAWTRRADPDRTARGDYEDGHGNAIVVGPGGVLDRPGLWLGATLLAPGVRYPDHTHAPEEVYLVVSDGEFRQGANPWFAPGIGGSF